VQKEEVQQKKIGKFKISELSDSLFEAYKIEVNDSRTWETQNEMIKALGRVSNLDSLPYTEKIVNENLEHDTITNYATTAYLRLKSKTIPDIIPVVIELLNNGKYSVIDGCLRALIYDDIVLTKDDLEKIIKIINNYPNPYEVGLLDIRQPLVCLMSKYPKEQVINYLEEYKSNPNIHKDIIEYALKGKAYYPNEY
jgi:hypothetical protein